VLGLDQDWGAFQEVCARAPALAALLARHPGFRPVVFFSPWAAAGWSILSQRTRMSQAAALARRIAWGAGDVIAVEGETLAAFPRPQTFLARASHPGVSQEKWRRLQTVARAAMEGELDLDRLGAMPYAQARARLMELHGVGPWTADAVLVRGVGLADALPLVEPKLRAAVGWAYGLSRTPSAAEVEAIAESWRPFRTWVSILLIMGLRRSADVEGSPAVPGMNPPGRRRSRWSPASGREEVRP
jgi:DNA-3-methyladenine glycosylase II